MPVEVEIILQSDGSLLISRGSKEQNEVLAKILNSMTDISDLDSFFSISEQTENIIGKTDLCG